MGAPTACVAGALQPLLSAKPDGDVPDSDGTHPFILTLELFLDGGMAGFELSEVSCVFIRLRLSKFAPIQQK